MNENSFLEFHPINIGCFPKETSQQNKTKIFELCLSIYNKRRHIRIFEWEYENCTVLADDFIKTVELNQLQLDLFICSKAEEFPDKLRLKFAHKEHTGIIDFTWQVLAEWER